MNGCQESQMSEDALNAKVIILTVKEKRCPRCKETKPIERFYSNKCKKDGYSDQCRECSDRGFKDVILELQNREPSDVCLHEKTINMCVKCHKRLS